MSGFPLSQICPYSFLDMLVLRMELINQKSFKLTTNWAFDLFAPSASDTIFPGRMTVMMMSFSPASPHHSPHQGVPHAALKASHPAALRVRPPAVSCPVPHELPMSPRIPLFFVCQAKYIALHYELPRPHPRPVRIPTVALMIIPDTLIILDNS